MGPATLLDIAYWHFPTLIFYENSENARSTVDCRPIREGGITVDDSQIQERPSGKGESGKHPTATIGAGRFRLGHPNRFPALPAFELITAGYSSLSTDRGP